MKLNKEQKRSIATVFENIGTLCVATIASVSYNFIKLETLDLVLLYILTAMLFAISIAIRHETGAKDE